MIFTTENTGIKAQGHLKILNISLSLFNQGGIDSTSIRDIARTAGLSNPALYAHYSSKEELAYDLFRMILENFGRRTREILNASMPLPLIFKRFGQEMLLECLMDPSGYDCFSYIHQNSQRFMARLIKEGDTPFNVWREFIRKNQALNQIREGNPDILAMMVIGIMIKPMEACMKGVIQIDHSEFCLEFQKTLELLLCKNS